VVQDNSNANPPTLLLTLHSMLADLRLNNDGRVPTWFAEHVARLWPRLQVWYDWFYNTQQGSLPGTYRYKQDVIK
jgi:hypothetical protein